MCRVVTRELGRGTHVVADARRFVNHALDRWELSGLSPDAELMVSELVTNALLHARTAVAMTVAVADGTLEVGVTDGSRDLPHPRHASHAPPARSRRGGRLPEGGRGLHLVDRLADDWGTAVLAHGKQVWFRVAVDEGWPHRTGCPCAGEALERVRLESGRYAVAAPGPWDQH